MNKQKPVNVEEFVGFEILTYVFGLSKRSMYDLRSGDFFDTVRQISTGIQTKYHFGDCVRYISPNLTDYDVARLRIEIHEKLLQKRKGRGPHAKKTQKE